MEFSGRAQGRTAQIGIVVSRFNDLITERLLAGAHSCLLDHGVPGERIDTAWVPGAWELPLAAQHMIERRSCDGIIALGCVIRGDTPHFDFVAGAAATGLASVSAATGAPIAFGVLTTDTLEQALDRAGGKAGNKGWEAALSVLEMIDLLSGLEAVRGS